MKRINYYVASSIDGYISGPNDDTSGFVDSSNGVEKYLNDLKKFETVIMGKNTYTYGYKYGLIPGKPAYPHMTHYIFSKTLAFENLDEKIKIIRNIDTAEIINIKNNSNTDIYLCGGGIFAGWLLDNELIDLLTLKVNPLILGQGGKLFGNSIKNFKLKLINNGEYDDGLLINTYEINY